jgi:hypothetical protein
MTRKNAENQDEQSGEGSCCQQFLSLKLAFILGKSALFIPPD